MASNDPYELAKSEDRQARFERRAINSFGPDDPYDFVVPQMPMKSSTQPPAAKTKKEVDTRTLFEKR